MDKRSKTKSAGVVSRRNAVALLSGAWGSWPPLRSTRAGIEAAVHIHLKVHIGGDVVHTGQLFFDDDLTDKVFRRSPYSSHGTRDTRNDADSIYNNSGAVASVLAVTANSDAYTGRITLGVKQT